MTISAAPETKFYYCKTYVTQDGNYSSSHQDFGFDGEEPTREELIGHLDDVLGGSNLENDNGNWEEKGEDEWYEPNLFGMTSYEFATYLFDNEEEAKEKYGTEWEVCTNLDLVDEEWNHPCNL
jgi:hypothetical protein